jgi:hypothetical protein
MIKIATKVFRTEEVELLDGTSVTLRSLPIARLRKAMEKINELFEAGPTDDGLGYVDQLVDVALVCVGQHEHLSTKEQLEEVVDSETLFKIIEVSTGVVLNDPKAMELASAAVEKAQGATN